MSVFNLLIDNWYFTLDADDLIDELIRENLIGQNAAQRVQLMGTSRVEKNRIIFDQLITCGPGALEKFCEILRRKKRQSFIADQLGMLVDHNNINNCVIIYVICDLIIRPCRHAKPVSGIFIVHYTKLCFVAKIV